MRDQALQYPDLFNPEYIVVFDMPNKGYDFGLWTRGLKELETGSVKRYRKRMKYFVFLNSGVRGPFLTVAAAGSKSHRHIWTELLGDLLDDEIKLVGPSINCMCVKHEVTQERRCTAHIQSYTLATDRVGLQILKDAKVFGPMYKTKNEVIHACELGASEAILKAGYNLQALMTKYRKVDWRDKSTQNCNNFVNPTEMFGANGLTLNPFEVMFVKAKSYMLLNEVLVERETKDMFEGKSGHVSEGSNRVKVAIQMGPCLASPYIRLMKSCGFQFDASFYRNYVDLDSLKFSEEQLRHHFEKFGFLEHRVYKIAPITKVVKQDGKEVIVKEKVKTSGKCQRFASWRDGKYAYGLLLPDDYVIHFG